MDQAVVAGVGNLLADEILWRARLEPRRPAGELSTEMARATVGGRTTFWCPAEQR